MGKFAEYFNINRMDSGWHRFLAIIFGYILVILFLISGVDLIKSGVKGEWAIVSTFKGWTLYATSLSPGVLVVLLGVVIAVWAIPKILKSIGP